MYCKNITPDNDLMTTKGLMIMKVMMMAAAAAAVVVVVVEVCTPAKH
jgi:hypothetical protein